jgi:(hydroxyamino)benzene mutase
MSRSLKMAGMLLFLFGLLTGFITMSLKNPRMGLAAHLEGVMNGPFLVIAGIIWNELRLAEALKKIVFWTLLYGAFVNWMVTLVAAILGTSKMTPLTGQGFGGTLLQENIVNAGFISVGIAMVFSAALVTYGLRGRLAKAVL